MHSPTLLPQHLVDLRCNLKQQSLGRWTLDSTDPNAILEHILEALAQVIHPLSIAGTGACATVVAGVLEGKIERKCR